MNLDHLLHAYVLARNNRRSSESEANGFNTGRRVYALKLAAQNERAALVALGDWAETEARRQLGLPPTPVGKNP